MIDLRMIRVVQGQSREQVLAEVLETEEMPSFVITWTPARETCACHRCLGLVFRWPAMVTLGLVIAGFTTLFIASLAWIADRIGS